MSNRDEARQLWLAQNLSSFQPPSLLAGDASFRRYFRLHADGHSYVLMDAPPQKESCQSFVAIAHTFEQLGLCVPKIYKADVAEGFLLLSDFGDHQLLPSLTDDTVDTYYKKAFEDLLIMQRCRSVNDYVLPAFDEVLYQRELDLFSDWYLERHCGLTLSLDDRQFLADLSAQLIEIALGQPQVFVHRDYHSRNLMILPDDRLGILDFQDAVWGPITYDLMSLLRDCYVAWPYERVKTWSLYFHRRLLEEGLCQVEDPDEFLWWCDTIALQRHLKCIGIFSRLCYRDNKPGYMNDIPRVMAYVKSVCERRSDFAPLLGRFIQ